jgi:hypothetical protein
MPIFCAVLIALLLSACTLTGQSATRPAGGVTPGSGVQSGLVVAWMQAGDLYVWTQAEAQARRIASGGVIRPQISPDGAHIAFARGPGGVPETLWVADINGTAEREVVRRQDLPAITSQIRSVPGEFMWLDSEVLLFNTLAQDSAGNLDARHDLYRVHIDRLDTALLRRPGEGGAIHISPDRTLIVTVAPGNYGVRDGALRVTDALGQSQADLLYFVGVSTGASYRFYPRAFWLPDGSAVYAAIPDADAVYDDGSVPPVALWRLPVDVPSGREIVGEITVSFFGLPIWSEDASRMYFLQREGQPADNRYALWTANADGSAAARIDAVQAGLISLFDWTPAGLLFNDGVNHAVLGVDGTPRSLLQTTYLTVPVFVDADRYMFVGGAPDDQLGVYLARLSDGTAETLALFPPTANTALDALVIP